MPEFFDQLGRVVTLHEQPTRIISLVPSQTELLADLGLNDRVVGITKFCEHPDFWFRNKTRVGGTKNPNLQIIQSLKPDLIIANKEENNQEDVNLLAEQFPVWVSDVNNLADAKKMIQAIGQITATEQATEKLLFTISLAFDNLKTAEQKIRAAYLIWKDPCMTVGGDTFIHDMMTQAGYENVFADHNRYPEINISSLTSLGIEELLLSSEPYPFSQKHIDEWAPLLPGVKIRLVDGQMFSWYGSRLQFAPGYFNSLQEK